MNEEAKKKLNLLGTEALDLHESTLVILLLRLAADSRDRSR